MSGMTDLSTLAERLERATGPDRELDAEICRLTKFAVEHPDGSWMQYFSDGYRHSKDPPTLTASIDAALALVEATRPGRVWETLHEALLDKRVPMEGDCRMLPICVLSALVAAPASQEGQR